ncbi:MAG: hypothetical protein V3U09_01995 [Thermoplasmata archaeon]
MKEALKVTGAILVVVALLLVIAGSIGYCRSCPGGEEGDVLRTDRRCYVQGESVVFVLRNVWDHPINYAVDLRETLTVLDWNGDFVVMRTPLMHPSWVTLEPNETMELVWDQTYYLHKPGVDEVEWDQRTGTRVPPGRYTARIEDRDIMAEVSFRILP